jgi:hypothetical protein
MAVTVVPHRDEFFPEEKRGIEWSNAPVFDDERYVSSSGTRTLV